MNKEIKMKLTHLAFAACLLFGGGLLAQAQVTTGSVRGVVTDPNSAVVTDAKVTITKKSTNVSSTTQTSGSGVFEFSNLLVGDDYSVVIEAANFKTLSLTDVKVQLNQITDLSAQLELGAVGETVIVTSSGAELVDTTTSNLSKAFTARQVVELAQTSVGTSGVNNLALIAPNVSSSGGVGVGMGGSVGGQRTRNNNFMVDGVDNNDKGVTGPQGYISPEEVAEFSLLQNQFSAEFARSNGGQFITVTKSGTNDFHGTFYGFARNRYLNALDNLQKVAGVTRDKADGDLFMPRNDYFRGGYNLGGPVFMPKFGEGGPGLWKLRDKLFFFTSYERLQTGSAAGSAGIISPTAEGFQIINSTPGLSATNVGVFNTFMPVAPQADAQAADCRGPDCITVGGRVIPLGNVNIAAPNFTKQNHAVINLDYNQSKNTQHHWRFTMTNGTDIDNAANLPAFFALDPSKQRLFSYTLLHNFSANITNETRLAFRHSTQAFPTPDITFPGLDAFPNIDLDDLGLSIGPNQVVPQSAGENNYQIVNNVTWLLRDHSLKFGADFRNIIAPTRFVQRERGEYEYLAMEDFFRDLSPEFGERNVGGNTYYGNQKVLYAFFQDDWRVRPNLTLNLGLSYSYQGVPLGAKFQAANAISSVPGLIEFRAPKAQTKNFAPKFGFAWSPDFRDGLLGRMFGSAGKSSIRGGFSMGYDYIFDNVYTNSQPPQAQQTIDVSGTGSTTHFLANGGIPPTPTGGLSDPATARLATSSFIPDQLVPYSLTWTTSVQRQFGNSWAVELRYLGTRGIHLLTQNRINIQAQVSPEDGRAGLPTFITGAPTQAQIDALPANTLSLADIQSRPLIVPSFDAAGFNGNNLVAFLSNGNSTYHAGSAQVTKRLTKGLQLTGAYTWSHFIDDTTAEFFSTVLSPRRVEDFQNLRRERADSALDRRHRFVSSWIYELPWFKNGNGLTKTLLGGFSIAGTFTAESGEKVTVRSGNDANQNGDNAGDRGILNPGGTEGVGSTVTALVRTCPSFNSDGSCTTSAAARTIGYVANNPNAKYIQAGNGAVSNLGRNTFQLPGINNVDFSVFKNFRISESKAIQFRVDFFNAFNHPQFVPGSINTVDPISTAGLTTLNQIAPLTGDFLRADRVLSSNPRIIQLGARFNF
ncbi:MAG TPA: carboxypeptidase regulatory-like domain-containing protein [Pyrinomonadaceae bacterium]|nr:carboxypeptidase regulatory-like domain-containing protein [Pyrinomonadaceae bacterium]